MKDEIKIIDTSVITESPDINGGLFENRRRLNKRYEKDINITILVQAYNRIEKTKECINSIFKYTLDHKFKLLLLDNGSNDGTLEYFQKIDFFPKKILRLTNNRGAGLATDIGLKECDTKYIILVTNDTIVTEKWLDNLLKCAESDGRIGQVNPLVTNSSTDYLDPLPEINSIEEAEEYGRIHNKSNKHLWAERLRCASLCYLLRKEAIDASGGIDIGYFHEFAEDDLQIRMRRAGYKLFLAEDTFVHHNHYMEERNVQRGITSTNSGYQNYMQKHRGIDPWNDMNNYIYPYIKKIQCRKESKILGIDTRCGQPLLDFKNKFWREGIEIKETDIFAYTQTAKYYDILRTVTPNVICNKERRLIEYYDKESFDAVVVGEVINTYHNPMEFLKNVLDLVKKGGTLVVSIYNVYDFRTLFAEIIESQWRNMDEYVQIHYEDIIKILKTEGAEYVEIYNVPHTITEEMKSIIQKVNHIIKDLEANPEDVYQRLLTQKYWFCIKK